MNYEQLKETFFDGRPVVLKCGTEFCQPCKVMDKTLDRLEPQYKNVQFIHVDVGEEQELAQELQITNVPVTFFISADGKDFVRKVGLMPEKAIVAEIENLLNV